MDGQNISTNNDTPQSDKKLTKILKNKWALGAITAVTVFIIGGVILAATRPKDTDRQVSQKTPQAEECAPRNTPTCGPDGKPIGGTVSTNLPKALEAITGSKIQLTGSGPQGLDIDPLTGYVYVGNNGNIISGCEGDTTKPGQAPAAAPLKPGSSTLSIVDPASGRELKRVDTQSAPIWPLVDTERSVVYVPGSGDGKIAVHKLGSGEKVSVITVGGKPHAFGQKGNVIIVPNTHNDTQTFMSSINADTRQVIKAQSAPEFPHGIVYDSKKNVFYMVGVKTGTVAVVDAATGNITDTFTPLSGNGNSNMLAFSEKTRKLFISDSQQQSSVTVVDVDSRQKLGTIAFTQTASPVWGMQVDDANGLLYAALPNSDAVGIAEVSSLKPLGLVKVDTCPYAVRLDTKRDLGITTNQVNATVSTFKLSDVKKALGR